MPPDTIKKIKMKNKSGEIWDGRERVPRQWLQALQSLPTAPGMDANGSTVLPKPFYRMLRNHVVSFLKKDVGK